MKPVKVTVSQGVVVGRQNAASAISKGYCSFQGIPYAVPPLGDLRFQSPVALEKFQVPELDCRAERSVCTQYDIFRKKIVGSEDCLFLNVYTPQVAETSCPDLLPVIVYIHGGGFSNGSGNSDYKLPAAFMNEDIVVVTINYRLGVLGFLCCPEERVWGNAGLKDQRLALQWVHENISHFNGDPGNVTLMGESAGGASVHLHTLGPNANRLFHKAIAQSGTASTQFVFQSDWMERARKLARLLGSDAHTARELVQFLRSPAATAERLARFISAALFPNGMQSNRLHFWPVVEDPASPDAFITEPVYGLLQRPDSQSVPMIMGHNSGEGIVILADAVANLAAYDKDMQRFVPHNMRVGAEQRPFLAEKLRDFYLQGARLDPANYDQFADLAGDCLLRMDAQRAYRWHVDLQPRAPLFLYRFDYVGGRNLFKQLFRMEAVRGACHGDELLYLFQMAGEEGRLAPVDALLTQRMCRLWANFARCGEPTPMGPEPPVIDCKWTPAGKSEELNFYLIDKKCQMQPNPEGERIRFLNELYKPYKFTDYSRSKL